MRRSAYTLVEVLLALGIAVLLLAALYVAVDTQLKSAQAGRDKVDQSKLAATLFAQMDNDASYVIGLADTARFRTMQTPSSGGSTGSGSTGSGSTGTGSTGTGSTGTGSTGTGSTGTGSTGTGSTGSGSSSGSSSSPVQITSLSYTGNVSTYTNANGVQVIILPYGVIGDSQTLNMFVSRVPREMIDAQLQNQQGSVPFASDLRRVSYWFVEGQGLLKQEVKVATSDDSGAVEEGSLPPNSSDNAQVLMEEVKSLQFQYWDGFDWYDSWDSTQLPSESGDANSQYADGYTPQGSPLAISVTVTIANPNNPNQTKTYKHVIAFLNANGTTPLIPNSNGTTGTTGGGTTTP